MQDGGLWLCETIEMARKQQLVRLYAEFTDRQRPEQETKPTFVRAQKVCQLQSNAEREEREFVKSETEGKTDWWQQTCTRSSQRRVCKRRKTMLGKKTTRSGGSIRGEADGEDQKARGKVHAGGGRSQGASPQEQGSQENFHRECRGSSCSVLDASSIVSVLSQATRDMYQDMLDPATRDTNGRARPTEFGGPISTKEKQNRLPLGAGKGRRNGVRKLQGL